MIPVSQPSFSDLERAALLRTYDSGQITHGPEVESFESEFSSYLGVPHAVACSSGTTALHLALLALEIGPGDEVIVPNLTFVATANAVRYVGATPVLCDISPTTWCIDPTRIERLLTPRTRAIIAVHLYGVPCDMAHLSHIALTNNLYLIEDAAEGLGGTYNNTPLGTHSDIATFSFYGNKVMTTGEGGMIVTPTFRFADRARYLRGQAVHTSLPFKSRYYHGEVGYNYRLTSLQAAIGRVQLSRLPYLLARRKHVIDTYNSLLGDWVEAPCCNTPGAAPWLYTVLLPSIADLNTISASLHSEGIDTRPVFVPMNLLPAYADTSNDYPISLMAWRRGISLPTYPDLTPEEIEHVAEALYRAVH